MNLSVIIATRGRPAQAATVIDALRLMSSGLHAVSYMVACDDDDPEDTAGRFLTDLAAPDIGVYEWKRPAGVGECWNRVVPFATGDIVLTLTDDALIGTPYWDAVMVDAFAAQKWAHPDLAMACLNDTANPGQATLFAFRPAWFRHCGLFDERFPFWFADTGLAEVYSFLTGEMIPMLPVTAVLKPGVFNPRLREMRLWWRLYACTRMDRLQTAARVRAELGLPEPPNLDDLVAQWMARDLRGLPDSEAIAKAIPNPRPPDEAYERARAAALETIARWPRAAAHIDMFAMEAA
jgi:glycosyltransferase involved in cell wall biosynthesis